jgi:hypothetical protein
MKDTQDYMQATRDAEAFLEIVAHFHEEQSPECEYRHKKTVCTHTIVAILRATCNGVSRKACLNAILYKQKKMAQGVRCAHCRRPAQECWTITPVGGDA